MYSKILVATDGSDNALRAVEHAADLGETCGASVTLICVAYVPIMYRHTLSSEVLETFVEDARGILEDTRKVFERRGALVETKLVREGYPPHAICDEAEDGGYDLIIVGSRGLSEERERALGSTSTRVIRLAECPVLVVK